ncbi:glycoside hydrolase family 32 protein [Clostridium bowmanii]|uniref:glycoside hydrolase family 32 protein n=1 Tax=Clostridium bowmanii TaxID=132925 RepID=UPI001C0C74D8|nr:glycoside hydrolase family 32 protein [Clostridium bowmanii]MBU3188072.1 glycoside hydrolase family 32 protein [Clostridium bowmanii]MCA1072253.1 glycoside hydrolase family 32 protein [Clostridium bowmanii]
MVINDLCESNKFIQTNKFKINKEYRLNYHLMGEFGWINDPNGFIQFNGSYHVFYQHYPYKAIWGPMHWGHAVSEDLIKWRHLPIALTPDREFDKDGCFSGSAIEVDGRLKLIYTGHIYTDGNKNTGYRQVQCLANSEDGINFSKFSLNPIIDTDEIPQAISKSDLRDPKVLKINEIYYMILGTTVDNKKNVDLSKNGAVAIYKSLDLIHWDFINVLASSDGNMGICWECPDLFTLGGKEVLIVSPQYMKPQGNDYHNLHSTIYMIGDLQINEGAFKFDEYYPIDYGFDFYAPQTIIDDKGRRILIAWMDMWGSKMPTQDRGDNWAGAMTLPREIIFYEDRLIFKPIQEIIKYRKNEYKIEDVLLIGEKLLDITGESYEIIVIFEAKNFSEFGIKLRVGEKEETVLSYNAMSKIFSFNRDKSGIGPKGIRNTELVLKDNALKLQIFVDKCSVEVFINDGEKTMTARIYPSAFSNKIKIFSKGECNIVTFHKWDIG